MELFGQQLSWIEGWGTFFGILGVYLTVKKSIYCFPAGIINVALYAVLFFESKLYADAALQLFYVFLLIYGWIQWQKPNLNHQFKVTTTDRNSWLRLAGLCLVFTLILGSVFRFYTDASLPYLDSLLASMSLIAQLMVAKKKIENWLVWIVADIIYIGMYLYKQLYLTSALYLMFIVLAIFGYWEWKKNLAVHERSN